MRMSSDKPNFTMEEVTIPDLKNIRDNIYKLVDDLAAFRVAIVPKLPALLEKYHKQAPPCFAVTGGGTGGRRGSRCAWLHHSLRRLSLGWFKDALERRGGLARRH